MASLNTSLRANVALLLAVCFSGATLPAQTPQPSTSFEVASVRVVQAGAFTKFPEFPAPQFVAENVSLKLLIAIAYQMSDDRLVGAEGWMNDTLYTIRAKPEGDAALTEEQYTPLLQDLLKQRFHLAVHRETREVPGYELQLEKGGPKMEKAEFDAKAMAYILDNGLDSPSAAMETIASLLSRPLGKPVVDRTGIKGTFKLKLRFAPQSGTMSDLPDIFTAVQEQLGLKLVAKKVPAEFLVVDHADKLTQVD